MKYAKRAYELSRPLQVNKISLGGMQDHIVASELERQELTKRFSFVDLPRLEAFLTVERAEGHMFSVKGRISADVVQSCVVTLEPVPVTLNETIDVLFAPAHLIKKDNGTEELVDIDPPEPIKGGTIDLGELVAQHLFVALDLYPRKKEAVFEGVKVENMVAEGKNPFKSLKKTLESSGKTNR
ncbi:MAG TPA: DUF177 domain-containing protein [Rhodospirillaceae bacterium]|nr:DUF177 domain-containing protein [Rhodospirillaceae bacterium]